jgi:hypothetical protein
MFSGEAKCKINPQLRIHLYMQVNMVQNEGAATKYEYYMKATGNGVKYRHKTNQQLQERQVHWQTELTSLFKDKL